MLSTHLNQLFLILLHSSCLLASYVVSNGTATVNPNDSSLLDVNADALGGERFKIKLFPTNIPINGLDTYTTMTKLLSLQALKDISYDVGSPIIFSLPPWDSVKVTIGPPPGGLPRRYIVWGLYQTMKTFADYGFVCITVHLLWDTKYVGQITIDKKDQSGILGADKTKTAALKATQAATMGNSTLPAEMVSRDLAFTTDVVYVSHAKTLTIPGTFLACAAAMTHLADRDKQSDFLPFYFKDDTYHVATIVNAPESAAAPVAAVIQAFWDIAAFVTRNRRFSEVQADVRVNGRDYARIVLAQFLSES